MPRDLVYLADLTHTGQSVASNVFPLGIGLLASFLDAHFGDDVEIELFKYPEDLHQALLRRVPRLIGFSNYSWNCHLSMQYARLIKEDHPDTIVLAGGPNYGLQRNEIEAFWARYPWLDFVIVKEGEQALVDLFGLLRDVGFDVDALERSGARPGNCHFASEGEIIEGPLLPRLRDLDTLGSPYLKGMMDKFFDEVLVPLVHTTRGCPFRCTFCSEGNDYYNKVAQRSQLEEELVYIAERRGDIHELMLTDANFGMYAQDVRKAEVIAGIQERYGWPTMLSTATGKNRKKRVLEVAGLLNGALTIAASLQTTDAAVLENIKRQNISSEALVEIADGSGQGARTYTELILALPGDTAAIHTRSLKDTVDAGLGIIRMYQLILLPQTEMSEPATQARYRFTTRFRINQRCFGTYPYGDRRFPSVECEQIVVANETMPLDDYLDCRELDLAVELFHNSGLFGELMQLCRLVGVSWFEILQDAYRALRDRTPELTALFDTFRAGSLPPWHTQDALEDEVLSNLERFTSDTEGTNEMVRAKAVAVLDHLDTLERTIYDVAELHLGRAGLDERLGRYLVELRDLSSKRKGAFLQTELSYEVDAHFDFDQIFQARFRVDPTEHYRPDGIRLRLYHTPEQKRLIASYLNRYGTSVEGIGRILMRSFTHNDRLYRTIEAIG